MNNDFIQNAVNNLYRDNELMALKAENARLKAEVERLRSASFTTAVPSEDYEYVKAQVERLIKAGDDMADHIQSGWVSAERAIDQWNAAKEGKQS